MPDLPNLENQGWEQMKMLLDRHLPQGDMPAPVASYKPSIVWPIAALWLAVLFCTPVLVADHKRDISPIRETASSTMHAADSLVASSTNGAVAASLPSANKAIATVDGSSTPATGNTLRYAYQQATGQQSYRQQRISRSFNKQSDQLITDDLFLKNFTTHISPVQQSVSADAASVSVLSGITASSDSANMYALDQALPTQQRLVANPAPIVAPAKPGHMPNKWALAVQVNRNLNSKTPSTESKLYNLPVYPSFTASYYLNKGISISTGLAALAPGHLNKRISSRTDNILITAASPPFSPPPTPFAVTNKEEIKQTYYFQVPLTVDVHLKNHFTLSAGVALAFLHKALLQTDNNLNNLRDSSMTLTTFRQLLAPASIEAATEVGKLYEIRKFDPRFLLGVSYQWHRFQLGVQYVRAIRSSVVSKYQPELNNHTELVNIHAGFQLFGPK